MKKYDIIYADPPWEYAQSGNKTTSRGMAKQHYNTIPIGTLKAFDISSIKHDKTVLFLWATLPNIQYALDLITAWGFIYKTAAFVWVKKYKHINKNVVGMGAYTRANAELCLLAISKNTHAKEVIKSHSVLQIVESPIEKHSKKPDEVRRRIVDLLGDRSRIELFAREKKEGWDAWGNEVESDITLDKI